MAVNIGPKIGVDGEREYRNQINQIIQQSKTLESQMKLVASQFTATTSAEEKTAKTAAVLTKQIDTQRERVMLLAEQTGKAAAKYGEADSRTQKWQQALNEAQVSLNKMRNGLRETTQGVDELNSSEEDGGKKTKSLADKIKDDFSAAADKGAGSALTFGKAILAHLASEAIIASVKALASAMKEVVAAAVDLGKQSIAAYAEYEQLIGGVDTLFKESSAQVQQYANEAYKTAGLSANQYMETVTSFSASLLQSLGGDTQEAAKMADMAITDMADNANKMGTDMQSIQNAYQGFAKQNYTMLDNLKLGYGGTAKEMARLVNESGVLGDRLIDLEDTKGLGAALQEVGYAKIVEAIHAVQTEMDITGTTAKEAASTLEGSANSMKSAWTNLLTGMSAENLDLDKLVRNAVNSVKTYADNLLPRIQTMAPRLAEGMTQLVNGLIPYVAPAVESLLPAVMQGFGGLVSGIVQALPAAVEAVSAVIPMMAEQIVTLLPQIIDSGMKIITALATGIGDNLPTLIPAAVDAVIEVASNLVANVDKLLVAAGQLIIGIGQGLIEELPHLIYRIPEIISAIVAAFMKGMPQIVNVGGQILAGLWEGIKNAAKWFYDKLAGWVDDMVGWIMKFLGINSPSKVFADEVGKFIPPGITLGVEQAMPKAMRDMGAQLSALSAVPMPGGTTTNLGGVSIVVYGAQGQDVSELADIVMARMQNAVERREAVFA